MFMQRASRLRAIDTTHVLTNMREVSVRRYLETECLVIRGFATVGISWLPANQNGIRLNVIPKIWGQGLLVTL